jgi:NAD-dependent SIR2 family protein deacetylase/ADP-ribosylglycohydrolase
MKRQSETFKSTAAILRNAERVFVLTGAGVSAESGVPTFRGGGQSQTWQGRSFSSLSSVTLIEEDLPLLWEWFDYRLDLISQCSPNAAHEVLAKASKSSRYKSFSLVTQNIDGLHESAGSEGVVELHGSIWRARCLGCGAIEPVSEIPKEERPPVCTECGDSMRPDVVLFGETLSSASYGLAHAYAAACDVCLVIGTSALVYPAAALPQAARRNGAKIIEINPEETAVSKYADISIRRAVAEVLPQLFSFIEEGDVDSGTLEEPPEIKEAIKAYLEEKGGEELTEEEFDLSPILDDRFRENRQRLVSFAFEGGGAELYRFTTDRGDTFLFVSGGSVDTNNETDDEWLWWGPVVVDSVKDGITRIAGEDLIFHIARAFIHPDCIEDVTEYVQKAFADLSETSLRKLALFKKPTTVEDWLSKANHDEALLDSTEEEAVVGTVGESQEEPHQSMKAVVVAEQEQSERAIYSYRINRHFLLFWRSTTLIAHERSKSLLDLISSNQISEVNNGDTLWVVTVIDGELVLCGRMVVGEVLDRRGASERFGDEDLWKSDWFAVAKESASCARLRRIHLGESAFDLRFNDEFEDRFVAADGRISRSQTRQMRELTDGTVELLEEVWKGGDLTEVSDEEIEILVRNLDSSSPPMVHSGETNGKLLGKFEGCLLGGAVGDALGAGVEFSSFENILELYGEDGVTDYVPCFGRLGAVTDETQLSLFTAEGLLRAEVRRKVKGICYPAAIVYNSYLRWLRTQGVELEGDELREQVYESPSWLEDISAMNSRRAPGNTCLSELASGVMGTTAEPLNSSKESGGLMRTAVVGLVTNEPFELAAEIAAITHGHPSAFLSAAVVAEIIRKLLSGHSLIDSIEHTLYEELPSHEGYEEILSVCHRALCLAKVQTREIGTNTSDVSTLELELRELKDLQIPSHRSVEWIGKGWVAEETLAIALYCSVVYSDDFRSGVELSINHSGNSNGVGALTGNILGAWLGIESVPDTWLQRLELKDVIHTVSRDLYSSFIEENGWEDRYPGH